MATQDQEQPTRTYQVTDAKMIQASKTMREAFIIDQADFVAYDPDFDSPYEDEWQSAIDAGEIYPTEEMLGDQEQQLTEAVEENMDLCRNKFQDSKRFIQKAFPGKSTIWNEFGFDNYGGARDTQADLLLFMRDFSVTANKYSAQLIAVNYTAPMITEIETVRDALDTADKAQNSFINALPGKTAERIDLMNAMYAFAQDVSEASKSIYRDDFAKRGKYLLPGTETATSAIVHVTKNATNQVGAIVELTNTALAAQVTDASGIVSFSSVNLPATLNITVTIEGAPIDFNNQPIILGQSNTIELLIT